MLRKTNLSPEQIEYLIIGTVIQEVKTSNIARETVLSCGLPLSIPAHTVTQACISSNQAITTAMGYINSGFVDVAIAGGVGKSLYLLSVFLILNSIASFPCRDNE